MLFNRKIEPKCEYCLRGEAIPASDMIACRLHGVMSPEEHCRRFTYDPINRVPEAPRAFTPKDFSEEDFTL